MRVKLKDVGKIVTGKTPSTKDPLNFIEEVPFITTVDLNNGFNLNYTERFISHKGFKSIFNNTISGISVLVNCIGSDMGNVGITDMTCATNQQINAITNIKGFCNPYYLYYCLILKKDYMRTIAGETAVPILSKSVFENIEIDLPPLEIQDKIAKILSSIDNQIEYNNAMTKRLQDLGNTIYSKIFKDCKDYVSLYDYPYLKLLKPGIDYFKDEKTYIPTAEVNENNINFNSSKITFDNRESRANMQPIYNSIWFAKMKNSNKHIYLTEKDKFIVENFIFSTGFCGLECKDFAFEYLIGTLELPYFEETKDKLSHGATMESINNDDLKSLIIKNPPKELLEKYHSKTKDIYMQISLLRMENFKLDTLKNNLLPLLINNQLEI